MKAESKATTKPGRRVLLGTAAAAVGAGIAASLPAVAAAGVPDAKEAELIGLCNRLVAISADRYRLYATMPQTTRDEEREMEAILAPGHAEWQKIEARIYELDVIPKTPAGISAVARAALAEAERAFDGAILTNCLGDWLAITVTEALEPGASAALEADARESNAAALRMVEASRQAGVAS